MLSNYQKFIHTSRYARWLGDRRETWEETVERYMSYMFDEQCSGVLSDDRDKIKDDILNLRVMPSMRAMMTAGPAARRDSTTIFNCAHTPVSKPSVFDETMYILMCGTGVGFTVEKEEVSKLPIIAEEFHSDPDITITVGDSKIGWAKAFRQLISLLYSGCVPKIDYSKIRPAGARLKTMGGRASGSQSLKELFLYTIGLFKQAAGRKLTPLECHDLMCKIGEVVVVGGVRRSALISLSDLGEFEMRDAKTGTWWENHGHRSLANNSAVYNGKPDMGTFIAEWQALHRSKSGERGIFNRDAARRKVAENGRRDPDHSWGTNPCSEIILRPYQFCNLSEVVVRAEDTPETLKEKIKSAVILGVAQSTCTNFRYLSSAWKKNTEEERLLGVSLTGVMDNEYFGDYRSDGLADVLSELRAYAVTVATEYAEKLGVNASVAVTCGKPSGTVSQLVDCASGVVHPRHSKYYIRTVRGDKKDPLSQLLRDSGVPCEDDIMRRESTYVFSFPMKAPDGARTQDEVNALDQLELWLMYSRYWCEHKVSATINVAEHEWMSVGAWVYEHFDEISGVSFLPKDGHTYQQAPYQAITAEEYNEWLNQGIPEVDFSKLSEYEKEDNTVGNREFACTGGSCEVVDIGK